MKACEDTAIQQGWLNEDQRLSGPMQESWKSGDFWVVYAVLHSFAFDAIYWLKIDARFFGAAESLEEAWRERLNLLDEGEKDEMEHLVARKVGNRSLEWDPDEYIAAFHGQLKREKADGAREIENGVKEDKSNEIEADVDDRYHKQ